jgi:hypothetical protein
LKPLNQPIRVAILATFAILTSSRNEAMGATYSTELSLTSGSSSWGEYLTARYDFGVAFKEVHSVRLELDMPEGFQGTMMSTGNGGLFRRLALEIHDPADPPPVEALSMFLGNSSINIPPGPPAEFSIARFLVSVGDLYVHADWPPFLLSGSGNVSLVDASTSYFHPLPDGDGSWSTTTWLPPSGIEGARLIIEAIPVPEPSAAALALAAVMSVHHAARRKSQRTGS